jgi:branched-chain amino acid transport system ATP-binding protein
MPGQTHQHTQPLLDVKSIEVVYDGSVLGVADTSLSVGHGEIVALLGSNGAGKSTTLKAISGLILADRGAVTKGAILFKGQATAGIAPNILATRGIVHVLEGRHVFPHLSVEENLRAGSFMRARSKRDFKDDLERIYTWFPRLKTKRNLQAGLASGGEQQMLAIGRALLTRPELVLLDEPSMGLAPLIMHEIFEIIVQLNAEQGTAFLVAEQNANVSLRHAHRGYVIESGRVALSGTADDLLATSNLHHIYLGTANASGVRSA